MKVGVLKLDPIKKMTTNFFTMVETLGTKVKNSLANGTKPDCAEEIKGSALATMTAFQSLHTERLKFIEILSGKLGNQGKLS